ncbi:MAG: hypothetical protein KGN36_01655, partial [Acidobacteriota bacterium]|nr:hypothetical protein [Acidobacteriota bacterium]
MAPAIPNSPLPQPAPHAAAPAAAASGKTAPTRAGWLAVWRGAAAPRDPAQLQLPVEPQAQAQTEASPLNLLLAAWLGQTPAAEAAPQAQAASAQGPPLPAPASDHPEPHADHLPALRPALPGAVLASAVTAIAP